MGEYSDLEAALPPHVLEELHRLGMPLASYTPWQVAAITRAALIDCRAFDDDAPDNPGDIEDMLELTTDEAATRQSPEVTVTGMIMAGVGGVAALPGLVGGFVARLLEERSHLFTLPEPVIALTQ